VATKTVELSEDTNLLEEIKKVKAQLAEQQQVIESQAEVIRRMKADDAGWLVLTVNPTFQGDLFDVTFTNGAGFVPENSYHERFDFPKMDGNKRAAYLVQFQDADERQAAVRKLDEREAMTTAERLVEELEHDCHCQVKYYGPDQGDEVRQVLAERTRQAKAAQQMAQDSDEGRTLMEKIAQAGQATRL